MNKFKKALPLGIIGSFFFAFTFVLNRSMNLSGGDWLWSASLRYFFTLPIMAVLLIKGNRMKQVFVSIKEKPVQWFLWSTIGFGLFYAPLSAASVYAESWFTAATWQITIVAGVLLTPIFGRKLPVKNLLISMIILFGIFLIQLPKAEHIGIGNLFTALALIIAAAFSYPLGNRKMMQVCDKSELTTIQRTFGMTLCSIPFWLLCSVFAGLRAGIPSGSQAVGSFLVALFSGVIATILFFKATDIVKDNPKQLAVIEATQSGEVIFTLFLGILILKDSMPRPVSIVGICLVILGMIFNSLAIEGVKEKNE